MKKRILALGLALVMVFALPTAASAADSFPDVESGRWSRGYIEDMTARGLYKGYDDGTFRPTAELTTGQAISICVRMCGFDEEQAGAAADDLYDAVYDAVGGEQPWFIEDFAVATAAGIVSLDELEALHADGKLGGALTREEFSEYLVRAMQLDEPTSVPALDFGDADEIGAEYGAAVYLLSTLGIVVGDTAHNFNPKNTIRREDSATMFSRAVKFADENSLLLELYDYSTYSVASGKVVSFDGSALVIENEIEGRREFALNSATGIYEGNVLSGAESIEAGRWARVCSNAAGVFAVRCYDGAGTVYAGELREFDGEVVTFNTGTRNLSFALDRATVYSAGGALGGSEIYDDEADYSAVTLAVDPTGRVAAIRFEGGSRAESLFLRAINEDGSITVATHGGAESTLKFAAGASLTLPNNATKLNKDCIGRRMDVRIDNVSGEILSLAVDSEREYVQGGFVRTTIRTNSRTITIENTTTGSTTGYKLSASAEVSFGGTAIKISELEAGQYVTLRLDGDTVDRIEAFPGSSTFEGVLRSISYGKTISFTVESADGEAREYSFASGSVPTIKRGNRVITADKLREGDTLTVSEKYSKIILIEASAAQADFTAVVEGISISSSGTTIELRREDTGETETYPLSATAEILSGETATSVSSIQGMRVAVTLGGSEIVLIDVKGAASESGELSGTVLFVNPTDRTILMQLSGGAQTTIYVPYTAAVHSVDGSSASFGTLEPEDSITVYGDIGADGSFTATIIIKK